MTKKLTALTSPVSPITPATLAPSDDFFLQMTLAVIDTLLQSPLSFALDAFHSQKPYYGYLVSDVMIESGACMTRVKNIRLYHLDTKRVIAYDGSSHSITINGCPLPPFNSPMPMSSDKKDDIDLETMPEPPTPATCHLKIISDGTRHGTHVVNLETGQHVNNVLSVDITMVPDEQPRAVITILGVHLEIATDATIATRQEEDFSDASTAL